MIKDPTLERIWEARRRIYEKCGNDPVQLVGYYLKRQQEKSADPLPIQNNKLKDVYPHEAVLSAA